MVARMSTVFQRLLDKTPYLGRVRRRLRELQQEVASLRSACGFVPPGHYYSPIPSQDQVDEYLRASSRSRSPASEVRIDHARFSHLLDVFARLYPDVAFPIEKQAEFRYYFANSLFICPDAVFLHCILRHVRPRRIIEVGCGFSSAVILDTAERNLGAWPDVTFVEPDSERLLALLKPGDESRCRLMRERIQRVDLEIFNALDAGDLLFIDSSHIVAAGSDVQYLLFEVLPRLRPGVLVHFHDIEWPFEYPADWLRNGRYWNEAYFLRAFLAYNEAWEVYWFNSYVAQNHRALLAQKMPLCLNGMGGSIYIKRVA